MRGQPDDDHDHRSVAVLPVHEISWVGAPRELPVGLIEDNRFPCLDLAQQDLCVDLARGGMPQLDEPVNPRLVLPGRVILMTRLLHQQLGKRLPLATVVLLVGDALTHTPSVPRAGANRAELALPAG